MISYNTGASWPRGSTRVSPSQVRRHTDRINSFVLPSSLLTHRVMASIVWEGCLWPFIWHLKSMDPNSGTQICCRVALETRNSSSLNLNTYSITEHSRGPRAAHCLQHLWLPETKLETNSRFLYNMQRHTNPHRNSRKATWRRKYFPFSLPKWYKDLASGTFVPNALATDKLHSFSWRLTKVWLRDTLSWHTHARDPGSMCMCVCMRVRTFVSARDQFCVCSHITSPFTTKLIKKATKQNNLGHGAD